MGHFSVDSARVPHRATTFNDFSRGADTARETNAAIDDQLAFLRVDHQVDLFSPAQRTKMAQLEQIVRGAGSQVGTPQLGLKLQEAVGRGALPRGHADFSHYCDALIRLASQPRTVASAQRTRSIAPASHRDPTPEVRPKPVLWQHIAGIDGTRDRLRALIEMQTYLPGTYRSDAVGLDPVNMVLLCGPPGTGKTSLAHAAAHARNCTFLQVTPASINTEKLGGSEKNIVTTFQEAIAKAPTIVLLDEADGLLSDAGTHATEAATAIRAQFINAIDQLIGHDVLVILATNNPQKISAAFHSRMQMRLYIPPPSLAGRQAILTQMFERETSQKVRAEIIELLARLTKGWSGRDLQQMLKAAALMWRQEEVHCTERFVRCPNGRWRIAAAHDAHAQVFTREQKRSMAFEPTYSDALLKKAFQTVSAERRNMARAAAESINAQAGMDAPDAEAADPGVPPANES